MSWKRKIRILRKRVVRFQTEEMRYGVNNDGTPYYWFKILKVREGEGKDTKFKVNIDYNKMKLNETTDIINSNDHLK